MVNYGEDLGLRLIKDKINGQDAEAVAKLGEKTKLALVSRSCTGLRSLTFNR